MRPMPTAGAGSEEALRVAASGATRGAAASVGPRAGVGGGVSEVPDDTAERGLAGKILRLAVFGRRGAERTAGTGCRCVPNVGEGGARGEQWQLGIHQIVWPLSLSGALEHLRADHLLKSRP